VQPSNQKNQSEHIQDDSAVPPQNNDTQKNELHGIEDNAANIIGSITPAQIEISDTSEKSLLVATRILMPEKR
jgi:hypothetical protein